MEVVIIFVSLSLILFPFEDDKSAKIDNLILLNISEKTSPRTISFSLICVLRAQQLLHIIFFRAVSFCLLLLLHNNNNWGQAKRMFIHLHFQYHHIWSQHFLPTPTFVSHHHHPFLRRFACFKWLISRKTHGGDWSR